MSDTAADLDGGRRTSARRRRLAVGAACAAALALVCGIAAGVAAVVSRSTPAPGPSGASSLYIPVLGGAAPGAPAVGSGGAGYSGGAVMGAPQAALSQAAPGGGAAMSGIAYPYPGSWCNGAAAPASAGPGITATGLAQVTLPGSPQNVETLNAGVQSSNAADVASALSDARQRLTAIHGALRRAGVPDADISQPSLNVYANGAPKPANVGVNGNVSATITDPAVLDRALDAVVAAGASDVNVWSGGGGAGATPDQASVQSAIAKATNAAKSTAQAEAQAAGVSLGSLQALQAQPPAICGWSPAGAQMVVAVTVTYAVK